MNIEECQLTDPELLKLLLDNGADGEVDWMDRLLVNAATEKALRVMLLWMSGQTLIARMLAELEAMLLAAEVVDDCSTLFQLLATYRQAQCKHKPGASVTQEERGEGHDGNS